MAHFLTHYCSREHLATWPSLTRADRGQSGSWIPQTPLAGSRCHLRLPGSRSKGDDYGLKLAKVSVVAGIDLKVPLGPNPRGTRCEF
jgi:hypothetical protein